MGTLLRVRPLLSFDEGELKVFGLKQQGFLRSWARPWARDHQGSIKRCTRGVKADIQLLKGSKRRTRKQDWHAFEQAQTLIESGFEYVTDIQSGEIVHNLFGKKKSWQPS